MSDWRFEASCLEEDPELFFPIGNTGPAVLQIEEAKAVCHRCPVAETCLNWALDPDTRQDHGVWGGMSEDERRSMKRRAARVQRAENPKPRRKRPSIPRSPQPRLTADNRKLVPAEYTLQVVQNLRKGPDPLSWRKIGLQLKTSEGTCRSVYKGDRDKVSRAVEQTAMKLLNA